MKRNYNFNDIPSELKQVSQWVLWKYEERNGKKTKVPYQPSGDMAQANARRTWCSFATAVKFYLNDANDYDGIGFVFSRQDDFVGIDIDHCIEPESNELTAFAREIIDNVDSYTEFSPSGEGIHIIIRGKLPQSFVGTGRKSVEHGLECYSWGRFFTFTGNKENSNGIYERTEKFANLYETYFPQDEKSAKIILSNYQKDEMGCSDKELWERMFRSASGDEIRNLFNGYLINDDHSSSDMALCNYLAFWTGNSAPRMDSMFRQTDLIREKWDKIHHSSGETYGERTIAMAISSTQNTILDNRQSDETFTFNIVGAGVDESAIEETKEENGAIPFFPLTELGNAERIAHEYGNVIRSVNGKEWRIWNGKIWRSDEHREIERIIAKVLRRLTDSSNEAVEKWGINCEKRSIRANAEKDLISLVPIGREQFDQNLYYFNTQNGVVDLKTGKLLPHDRELYITKISNVEFDENAKCPNWLEFLNSIFLGDKDLIDYIQRVIGYSLTGEITEQSMYFFVGDGSNGKSTFINVIKDLFGDYARQAQSDTFIKKHGNGINNDIARLAGARMVSAIESEEGERLGETLVKQITGGEPVTARFLNKEYFEFKPTFKVFFTTNHRPIVGGTDEGIWRRIKLIPFDLNLPKNKRDKKLPEKLSLEMSGILNWAIEGCLKWQREGINEPTKITDATSAYKKDMDILGPFIEENCVVEVDNPNLKIEAIELYKEYSEFCYDTKDILIKNRSFYRMLEKKGIVKKKGTANKMYLFGITLKRLMPRVTETEQIVTETPNKSAFFVVK